MAPSPRTLAFVAAGAIALAGCGGDDPTVDDPPAGADGDDAAVDAGDGAPADDGDAAATGEEVVAASFAFEPTDLAVAVGTTVTFANEDEVGHTFTSGDGEGDGAFDVAVGPDETGEHTFEEAGTFPYFCQIHPSMTGTITVE